MLLEVAMGLLISAGISTAPPQEELPSAPSSRAAPPLSARFQALEGSLRPLVDGPLRVVVHQNVLSPQRGYSPVRVRMSNSTAKPLPVELVLTTPQGSSSVRRSVELAPGESRSMLFPIPTSYRYGMMTLRSPALSRPVTEPLNSAQAKSQSLMLIGAPGEAAGYLEETPDPNGFANPVGTFTVPAAELWDEFAGYVGFDAIILTSNTFSELPREARRAIEAYVATGGRLVLNAEERGLEKHLPLLTRGTPGEAQPYGLGEVWFCASMRECGIPLTHPAGYGPANPTHNTYTGQTLLTRVSTRTGAFLMMMLLFAVAVGPGSVWLARRRGTLLLLFFIPAVSLLTAVLLVVYSVLADGFGVQAATQGATWLDTKNHRAVSAGVGAFYANVSPRGPKLTAFEAVLPQGGNEAFSVDWTSGGQFGTDFLQTRTYQEWGLQSVVETRARLSLSRAGAGAMKIQNALGAPVQWGIVRKDGEIYSFKQVPDGAEGALEAYGLPVNDTQWPDAYVLRLGPSLIESLKRPLEEGEFLAFLETPPPFFKFGELRLNYEKSFHVVRGEVAQ